jgi:hypothetical protein
MAPRTRRSRTIADANHTKELSKENSASVQASTQRKHGAQYNIANRDTSDPARDKNPPGKR